MTRHRFACHAGARSYYLYVPDTKNRRPSGVVVMLHGCKQTAVDFAAATQMNTLADRLGFVVVYPEQEYAANPLGCWKWYSTDHQNRDQGEPAILAELTQFLCSSFGISRERTFVAGLSAGGAMAAILGAEYSDTFAGVGVHSGLIQGAAQDVRSAFDAMSRGTCPEAKQSVRPPKTRLIVFQGTHDQTVVPQNATDLFSSFCAAQKVKPTLRVTDGVSGSRSTTHAILNGPKNAALAELWMIEGAGHAWSGGSHSGSYADPLGPNASETMARFFLRPVLCESQGAADVSHVASLEQAA